MKRAKVVLTSGAFDVIHPGHVKMLWEAKRKGGKNARLVVVLATDETIRSRKNRDPIFDERSRALILSNLKPVDEVIVGCRKFSFRKVLEKVKPDIVVFGYDQDEIMEEFKKFIKESGLRIKVCKTRRYKVGEINSTTELINKLKKMHG